MEPDIVLRLLELAEPGTSFGDVGGREILKEAADHILAARACAEMMLQGTGQKIAENIATRTLAGRVLCVSDAEREAVEAAVGRANRIGTEYAIIDAATLRGLLERLK